MGDAMSVICVGVIGRDVVTTPAGERRSYHGGSPLYFSCSAAIVGMPPTLISSTRARGAPELLGALQQFGVNVEYVRVVEQTPLFEMHYRDDWSIDIDRFEVRGGTLPNSRQIVVDLTDAIAAAASTSFVHVCPDVPEVVLTYCRAASEAGAPVSIQIHLSQLKLGLEQIRQAVAHCSVVFLNEHEFLCLTGKAGLEQAVSSVQSWAPSRWLITTPRSVVLVEGDRMHRFAAMQAPCVDATGAGDAFAGGFIAATAQGVEAARSIRLGMLCATATVTGFGSSNLLCALDSRFSSVVLGYETS